MKNTVDILESGTFVVSDRRGDIDGSPVEPHGLFRNDTRFLSHWVLTVDGIRPVSLSVDETRYFAAQFFLAPTTGTTYVDSPISTIRSRVVLEDGFHEWITIINHCADERTLDVVVEAGADFADLFEVKDAIAEKQGEHYQRVDRTRDGDVLVFGYRREEYVRETWIRAVLGRPEIDGNTLRFSITLKPQEERVIELDVLPILDPINAPAFVDPSVWHEPAARLGLKAWEHGTPLLSCDWRPLEEIYERSLADLAALRFRSRLRPDSPLPAAGLPWFMTMFGRDSLITSLQALPFVPELADATLRVLADWQASHVDDFRDAEPGKILHEMRTGEMTAFEERPHSPYYGTADATMLWLILLDEYERWSGREDLVHRLEPVARRALHWIDEYGDRDGDGYVEYERRNTATGLENQCWKDSFDSIQWADGRLASLPRATAELQGYAYDAKRRSARLAREYWDDRVFAQQLEHEAAELKARFNRDFWLADRGYYALALDGDKRPVDALASNLGHLLWSGIVDDDKAPLVRDALMGDRLNSGWGIRTFATGQVGYNPIGYHVGTVWPHDTGIAVLGLCRYGFRRDASVLAMALLQAAHLFNGRLPEAFAGFARAMTSFPAEYPTACSPQAWASGAPLMLVRGILGLEPDGAYLRTDPHLPPQINSLSLERVPGRWGRTDVSAKGAGALVLDVDEDTRRSATVIEDLVREIATRIDPATTRGLHTTVGFDLGSLGCWRLVTNDGRMVVDRAEEDADCTIVTSPETLMALVRGERDPTTAFMSGKVRVRGDLRLAQQFLRFLVAPPSAGW